MLSPQRSFIVQIDSDAEIADGNLFGRLEHIVSGESHRFDGTKDLLRAIARLTTMASITKSGA